MSPQNANRAANLSPQQLPDLFPPLKVRGAVWGWIYRQPAIAVGGGLLLLVALLALFAPWIAQHDPSEMTPMLRGLKPSAAHWFGTDMLGRDLFARVVYGARVSLTVGLSVALLATVIGAAIGIISGFVKWADAIIMRITDGLMSIPPILLAIALTAVSQPSVANVIVAISIAEMPRMTRLVRGIVLSLRERQYVTAAIACGSSTPKIIWRHILPNTLAPISVQATYICAAAMITEAILSFIGAGAPPSIPSWGASFQRGAPCGSCGPIWFLYPPSFCL